MSTPLLSVCRKRRGCECEGSGIACSVIVRFECGCVGKGGNGCTVRFGLAVTLDGIEFYLLQEFFGLVYRTQDSVVAEVKRGAALACGLLCRNGIGKTHTGSLIPPTAIAVDSKGIDLCRLVVECYLLQQRTADYLGVGG